MSKLSKKSNESTLVALNLFHLVAKYFLDVLDVRWYAMICDTVCVCVTGFKRFQICVKCCILLQVFAASAGLGLQNAIPNALNALFKCLYLNLIQRIEFHIFHIFHHFEFVADSWFVALKNRFLCRSWGVMRRWILGALLFLPSFTSRRTTNWRTSSCHQDHQLAVSLVSCRHVSSVSSVSSYPLLFEMLWKGWKHLKASKTSGLNRLDSFNSFSWENALRINENIQTWDW